MRECSYASVSIYKQRQGNEGLHSKADRDVKPAEDLPIPIEPFDIREEQKKITKELMDYLGKRQRADIEQNLLRLRSSMTKDRELNQDKALLRESLKVDAKASPLIQPTTRSSPPDVVKKKSRILLFAKYNPKLFINKF